MLKQRRQKVFIVLRQYINVTINEIVNRKSQRVKAKLRRAAWQPRKLGLDWHEKALDRAIQKFARNHGLRIEEFSKKYDERELLKHAGDVLWNGGLNEIGWREKPLGTYKERARAAVEETKLSESVARGLKEDDPFPKHMIRLGSSTIIMSLIHAMNEIGSVDATHAAVAGEYYARESFRHHVENASPEEVIKTYLALKELQKREIPGSIASKIRKIYMDAMRKALEEHVKEIKKES